MFKLVCLLALSISASTCTKQNPKAPAPDDSSFCDAAQAKLLTLGCTDSQGRLLGGPNTLGKTYAERCRDAEQTDVPQAPKCISTVTSCDQVNPCLQQPQ
jgi:hypothetical protein